MRDISAKISAKLDFFVEKFNANQIEKLVGGFFTEDCIVTGSDVSYMVGRDAAIGVFNQIRGMLDSTNFEVVEIRQSKGDLHYCVVQTRAKMKDGSDFALKSLAIFRESGDDLLCEVDFFAAGAFE